MNIDIMINNIVLHYKLSCIYEKLQHYKGVKIQKKNKKNRERMDVYGCIGIGGVGYTCNALQRSFDSLWVALVRAIQGKDRLGDTLQRCK